jgi:PAS domain S-box-containing protein
MAREALAESEEKFRSIIQSSPMGMHMYRLEPDDRLVFIGANPTADSILGVDNNQFIGMPIEKAFPSSIETEIPRKYREVALSGDPWHLEQIDYKDKRVSGAFEVYAFRTGHRTMAVMFQEITERKRTEEALAESEEKFRTAFVTSPDPVTISSFENGVFIEVNEGFLANTGYTRDEVIGKSSIELGIWGDPYQRKEWIAQIRAKGKVENYEITMRIKGGTFRTALFSARTIQLGGAPHLLTVSRDITDFKRAQQALEESENRFRTVFHMSPDSIAL